MTSSKVHYICGLQIYALTYLHANFNLLFVFPLNNVRLFRYIQQAGGWNVSGAFNVSAWDIQSSLQIYHNQYNRGGLFSWAVGADERNSTRNIIQLDQGGLGLPSRDYYLNKTDKNVVSFLDLCQQSIRLVD